MVRFTASPLMGPVSHVHTPHMGLCCPRDMSVLRVHEELGVLYLNSIRYFKLGIFLLMILGS